jgi:hypothetical protein
MDLVKPCIVEVSPRRYRVGWHAFSIDGVRVFRLSEEKYKTQAEARAHVLRITEHAWKDAL